MTRPGGFDNFARDVMSGRNRSVGASLLRASLSLAEPFYAGSMTLRNAMYDRGILHTHRLPPRVVSVGNLTTGGTGKTPVVRWLADKLIKRDKRPAVLMRGYRSRETGGSDEQRMLESQLGDRAIVVANPDRVAGAAEAMRRTPPPDVFILDDAFQHRRVARDFNLVLINAAAPFGYDHVLPRGLMREPLRGLARAEAILLTRVNLASTDELARTEARLRSANPKARIFQAIHAHAALIQGETRRPIEDLHTRRHFVFSGVGDPQSLGTQFPSRAGERWFPDHHAYTSTDVAMLASAAREAGAEVLVTTEKDWVKLAPLVGGQSMPLWRTELRIEFRDDDETRLLDAILDATSPNPPAGSPAAAAAAP